MGQSTGASSKVEVRHGGTIQDHGGIVVEKLLDDVNAGRATIGFAIYAAGASTGPKAVTKPGMEFLMLLEGSLIAEVEGKDYAMAPGDSICFATTIPHRGWNPGKITARALYVNYLPSPD
jgi:uncharacterized cupin superfamily protein